MIIFHHPLPIKINGNSGSQVRPERILDAFRQLGYQVEVVSGYVWERQKDIKRIKSKIRDGWRPSCIYSESSTMPTLLTEPHHFPIQPFLDFGFFKWAKHMGIPIGLFYRDVHWRFAYYQKNVHWLKRTVSIPFYHYDWFQYTRLVDHLFLPSLMMKRALPSDWPDAKMSALPPGCNIHSTDYSNYEGIGAPKIRLLYVGGVTPPLYDLRDMVSVACTLPEVELTIICRADEWRVVKGLYGCCSENVKIVHTSGDDLKNYYSCTDLFILMRAPHQYLDFAMPVKVFEALGHGVPIITTSGTAVARFVEEENLGWVVASARELRLLLNNLKVNPNLIAEKRELVKKIRHRHTWQARASQVIATLCAKGCTK